MTAPIRYGDHAPPEFGTVCLACGAQSPCIVTDHCHEHGWVRGDVCPRCNAYMTSIDRRISPRLDAAMLAALVLHASRCPDCEPFGIEDLAPTTSPRSWGRDPDARIKLRIPADLLARVRVIAEREHRTVSAQVLSMAERSLNKEDQARNTA